MKGMIKLLYSLKKEFLLISRDIHAVTVLFIMPAVFIMIMSLAMRDLFESHSSVSIDVLVVNRDAGKGAEGFAKAIEGLTTFKFHRLDKDTPTKRLEELMLNGDTKFALIIREGLSAALEGNEGETKSVKNLELLVSPSVNVQTQMLLRGALEAKLARIRRDAFIDRLGGFLKDAGIDKTVLKEDGDPIEVRYAYQGGRSFKIPTAVQQSVPAWLVFSIFFIVIPISNTFISERGQGTLMRLKSMDVSHISLIVSKMIPYLFINAIQVIIMISIGKHVVPLLGGTALTLGGSLSGLILIAASVSFSAISLALLIASLARTTEQATTIGAVLNIIFAALGGIMVPTFVMPRFMQELANVSPMSWGLEGFLDIFLREGGAAEVIPESLSLLIFGAIMMSLTMIVLRRKRGV